MTDRRAENGCGSEEIFRSYLCAVRSARASSVPDAVQLSGGFFGVLVHYLCEIVMKMSIYFLILWSWTTAFH